MTDRQSDDSRVLHEIGTVDLKAGKHLPAYSENFSIFNFTGEDILYCNADGALLSLPTDFHELYDGKIIIRKKVNWNAGTELMQYLKNNRLIPEEVGNALGAYYKKTAEEEFNRLAGNRELEYDIVLDDPVSSVGGAYSVSNPDVILGTMNSLRSVKDLHRHRYLEGNGKVNKKDFITIGVVVEPTDMDITTRFIHVHNMFVHARPVQSAVLALGAVICLITGTLLHDPSVTKVEGETLDTFTGVVSALESASIIRGKEYDGREDIHKDLADMAKFEEEDRRRRLRHELNLEQHELKRQQTIHDMAISQMNAEHKVDLENTKTVLGMVTNFAKK